MLSLISGAPDAVKYSVIFVGAVLLLLEHFYIRLRAIVIIVLLCLSVFIVAFVFIFEAFRPEQGILFI
jgi:hypothetical protein